MVRIICDTNKEKSNVEKLMRIREFVLMGVAVIMRADIECFNYRTIQWRIKEK